MRSRRDGSKVETHEIDGRRRRLCVHRKGATRAFPAGTQDVPDDLRDVGHPVLLPGSMGTASWVLVGTDGGGAFHSAAHGAGRTMSRKQAKRHGQDGRRLRDELGVQGVDVRAGSVKDLPEEALYAYKDVDEVVRVCEDAGLARPVARLRPIGVVKGSGRRRSRIPPPPAHRPHVPDHLKPSRAKTARCRGRPAGGVGESLTR